MEATETAEAITSLDIEASPQDVWDALTTNDGLAGWMGEGSTVGDEQGDDLFVHDIVTGEQKRGVLDEVSPERRLGYTWWPETRPEEATRVAITLTPCEVGTRVTVVETQTSPASSPSASATVCWAWRAALLAVATSSLRLTAAA